ncbi:hypothetical protein AB0I81_00605 [Nonomuraea sp. NPDC050404]|uniref:hypothetical protein n=1 Tax=Nonomuraea sp. NPDC050404 TaxID=3155783 RepID=UPI0033CF6DE5
MKLINDRRAIRARVPPPTDDGFLMPAGYGLVNHASWPTLVDVPAQSDLPADLPRLRAGQLLPASFKASFKANGVAAQPIIFRRV